MNGSFAKGVAVCAGLLLVLLSLPPLAALLPNGGTTARLRDGLYRLRGRRSVESVGAGGYYQDLMRQAKSPRSKRHVNRTDYPWETS